MEPQSGCGRRGPGLHAAVALSGVKSASTHLLCSPSSREWETGARGTPPCGLWYPRHLSVQLRGPTVCNVQPSMVERELAARRW